MKTLTLKTKVGRTFTATITEELERVQINLAATEYGQYGDEVEVFAWLAQIFAAYDNDPRPLVMDNQHSGEVATIVGDENRGMAIIQGPTLQ